MLFEATVSKVNALSGSIRRSYISDEQQHLGANIVFAWPSAEIAVMGLKALRTLYSKRNSSS